jgi:type VI secretion system protein VasD
MPRRVPGQRKSTAFLPALLLLALVVPALMACVTPPPPPPTRVQMVVEASPDANPDQAGRPSPTVVRVYELTGPSSFQEGDFFQLFEQPEATLGSDLRDSSDIVVAPGGRETLARELSPDTRYIGILANFRDIDQARWREGFVVPAHQTSTVVVRIGRLDVSVSRRGGDGAS